MKPNLASAYTLFHQGTLALSEMEHHGIRIDTDYLDKTIPKMKRKIAEAEESLKKDPIWKAWARRFGDQRNIDSPNQMRWAVYEHLEYKPTAFTDSGLPSTDEAALEDIADKIPFIKNHLLTKKLKKVLGTYLTGVRRETMNGYAHPMYSLAGGSKDDEGKGGAVSYRGSCSLFNFQNWPIRNPEMAAMIRPMCIARDNHQLVEVDLSTNEVRVAACNCKDPKLIEYMKGSGDMHLDAACDLFFLKPDQVDKRGTRDAAKNMFIFPQFFGSYYVDCAKAIWKGMLRRKFKVNGKETLIVDHLKSKGIKSLGECNPETQPVRGTFEYHVKQVEKILWEDRFKVYTAVKKKWWAEYQEKGYLDMFTGFRCQGVYRRNQVLNFRIQGPAFHILLQSIIWLTKIFKRRKMRSIIVGQIHDSLLIDAHKDEVEEVLKWCKRVMTVELPKVWKWMQTVPFIVEADVAPLGQSWHQKQPVAI